MILYKKMTAQRIKSLFMMLVLIVSTAVVYAGESTPHPIEVDKPQWQTVPSITGLEFVWIIGSQEQAGLYALRVKLDSGSKIPPHTHPDQRLTTVLSGNLFVGFGETFDPTKLIEIPQGNAYIVPADTPHFIWAKSGKVVYQETGIGPTATTILANQ